MSVHRAREIAIQAFVSSLGEYEPGPCVFNQYRIRTGHGDVCRANLNRFLLELAAHEPRVLLLGEAPGYRGCRLTGIPFTSESIMLEGVGSLGLLGSHRGYERIDPAGPIGREASATIVWETLASLSFIPVLWAAFPFHPHRADNPNSNRKPSADEIRLGTRFWQAIAEIFEIEHIVAVGNVAHQSLAFENVSSRRIRHPSHGGKRAFQEGLRSILSD
jgi:uracil-DNA glycosylase